MFCQHCRPSTELDVAALEALVKDFVAQGPSRWNDQTNTYWAGKNYGKVAELAAIADLVNMHVEATQLVDWLKSELSDWFTAESNGNLDVKKYFVYDEQWNTLLGIEESFQAHQQLNDHHFHYGYFVRAAAEICRQDASWCGQDQYGPMIELLIRDYAGGRDDPMFPYLRNFDPANGFSWASGNANFVRGNNNESVSEAANAYGAIVLYGLITGRDDLVERGILAQLLLRRLSGNTGTTSTATIMQRRRKITSLTVMTALRPQLFGVMGLLSQHGSVALTHTFLASRVCPLTRSCFTSANFPIICTTMLRWG